MYHFIVEFIKFLTGVNSGDNFQSINRAINAITKNIVLNSNEKPIFFLLFSLTTGHLNNNIKAMIIINIAGTKYLIIFINLMIKDQNKIANYK